MIVKTRMEHLRSLNRFLPSEQVLGAEQNASWEFVGIAWCSHIQKKKLTKIGWSTPKRSSIPIMFHQISWDSDETPHFFWHFTDILLCLDPPMAMAMILPPDHQGQHEPLEPLQGRRPSGARDVLAARGHGERAEAADDGLRGERRRGAGLATPRWRCPLVELCVARDGKQRKIDWSPLWGHRFQYNYIYNILYSIDV